jgi:hypothetical protein
LIALYLTIVPDSFDEDDPRRESIALELYDIQQAVDLESAMAIISFWDFPDDLAEKVVSSVRIAHEGPGFARSD